MPSDVPMKSGHSSKHLPRNVETGLKHHPRQRLTKEEVDALNSLVYARTDLIKITSVLSKKTEEEKLKLFRTEKFMTWWIRSSAELIQHWYSIEENISSPVLTKDVLLSTNEKRSEL